MDRPDRAVQLFGQGYACSQAVLLAWSPELGLDDSSAERISAPFAAGMRAGSTCGAVTGALMVLGMATCDASCSTAEGRGSSAGPTLEFLDRFRSQVGSLECPEIIGCDMRDPADVSRAREGGLFSSVCAPAVRTAVELLDELIPSLRPASG